MQTLKPVQIRRISAKICHDLGHSSVACPPHSGTMGSITLAATSSLSLPPDSYIYCIAALDHALAAISSDDSLRVFDPETLQLASGLALEKIHIGVTCLKSVSSGSNAVATAGRDGFIRGWDLRTGKKSLEIKDCTESTEGLCSIYLRCQ